ncbi:MAG: ATP synthase F0 subunit C [Eubacterium sp.]|nr:ATP synthase F0 subunit C [Eubacterium sp.]
MKTTVKRFFALLAMIMMVFAVSSAVYGAAEDEAASETVTIEEESETSAEADVSTESKAKYAGLAIGIASAAGALGMAFSIAKSVEGIARQPEADGKIRTSLMLGLVFIETAIIYALIIAILIIFVL